MANTVDELGGLMPGWDGYRGAPPSEAAAAAARDLQFVPLSDGGIQIELHGVNASVEIAIGPDGSVSNVSVSPVK